MHRRLEDSSAPSGDEFELRQLVLHSNVEELSQLVRISISKPDATKILDDLLQSLSDSDAHQLKRRKLIECSLNSLEKAKIPEAQANGIVNRIIFDLPRHSKQHLIKLVDFCLASIRTEDNELHSWKDLLPVLLESLENEKYVIHEDAEVSGMEYKSSVVKAICGYRWNVQLLPSLTKMFGDISLDKADRNVVLRTLCSALAELRTEQVPSFVYHALKLYKDRDNQKLLDALSKYFHRFYSELPRSVHEKTSFESIDTINIKEVRDTESTVLYYVYQAAQLNHDSMRDFIRFLKQVSHAPEYTLQPFMLAVLMSVSSIYEDQIFEILRIAIVNNSLEYEKRRSSGWLRVLLPTSSNIIAIIRQVIDSSHKDRHLVLRGLTSLAFMLMSADNKLKSNATTAWRTGSEILWEITKKCHETVPIVLQELISKIIGASAPVTHYTDCLRYMCRELSVIVLDHQAWIMTLLERLLFLPTSAANQALYAVLPLMHVSPNIRENLLLTLRKALYRKGTFKRQVAVTGFLEMLKYSGFHSLGNFRYSQRCNSSGYAASSSSGSILTQVSLEYNSQRQKAFVECNKTLCVEILDILKKSFSYEFQVRLHMYEGLCDTVTKNPEITELVLDMVLAHFDVYYNADDDALPPVKLELCIDTRGTDPLIKEPIGQLIFLLQKIYSNTRAKDSIVLDKLYGTLESLCRRMAITDLEHLNLEDGIDLTREDSTKSQIKIKTVDAIITIYEALIAFQIARLTSGHQESVQKILDLFKAYSRWVEFVKRPPPRMKRSIDAGKAKKKDKDASKLSKKIVRSPNVKLPNTIMDLNLIHQILSLVYSGQSTSAVNITALRESQSLCLYILQTCEQLLQRTNLHTGGVSPMAATPKYLNAYVNIGGLLYRSFVLRLTAALADDPQIAILALQCFKDIACCMCASQQSVLATFLRSILQTKKDATTVVDTNLQLQEIIISMKPLLRAWLVENVDDDERKSSVPSLLLQIVEQFAYKIDYENHSHDQVLECMEEMLQLEGIQTLVLPALVQFYLNLEERTRTYGETPNDICLQLCRQAGSIDGTELTISSRYKIVRQDTVLQIYNVMNGRIKEKLNNASMLLMRLKAQDTIDRASGTVDEVCDNNSREKERNLCKQLSQISQFLVALANTLMEPGPCTDATFKNLQYLYHLLGSLTKYFNVKSNEQTAAFQAVKFIQVVQLAGKALKTTFYNLVMHVEEHQNKSHSKSDSYAKRNKILRETKVIPRVVYEIEQFNKEVLILSKKTGVPLENYMKHSVTRDFRIMNPELVEGLEKMDASMLSSSSVREDESESSNANTSESRNTSDAIPSSKRARTDDSSEF